MFEWDLEELFAEVARCGEVVFEFECGPHDSNAEGGRRHEVEIEIDGDPHELFVEAASRGDEVRVMKLWNTGHVTNVDYATDGGWTALLLAASKMHIEVAEFLLSVGASTECRMDNGLLTPLHIATILGDIEMILLLLRCGASPTAKALYGDTVLHIAFGREYAHSLSIPTENIQSADSADDILSVLRKIAIMEHKLRIFDVLVANGADVLGQNDLSETVLLIACSKGDDFVVRHVVDLLDENGHSETKRKLLNMPGRLCNSTPVNFAVYHGNLELVDLLLQHGANVEIKNDNGLAPLNTAAMYNRDDIVKCLLEFGANTETTKRGGNSPLLNASYGGYVSIVELLLHHNANINHKNIDGTSAFTAAASEGHLVIVKMLLANGADPDTRTNEGWTALLMAAQRGLIDIAKVLIDKDADVNCWSYNHCTALACAAQAGNTAICALLLENGASMTLLTTDGKSALHLAASRNHHESVMLLLNAGADRNARDFDGRTPAYTAMMDGYFPLVELIEADCTEATAVDGIWSTESLHELYRVTYKPNQGNPRNSTPSWYIDPPSITPIEPHAQLSLGLAKISFGTWLGTRVMLVHTAFTISTKQFHLRLFRKEVTLLYPLRHPHIVRFYGACHRDENPFVVLEHLQPITFREFVKKNKHRMWGILHEIALGVMYLHERGIVHGLLSGNNIKVGQDNLIRIMGFGPHTMFTMFGTQDFSKNWSAPEVLSGRDAVNLSDVYSLGMCIIEAVTGDLPYANEVRQKQDFKQLIRRGIPPEKPDTLSAHEWGLVQHMTHLHGRKRLKITDVARELETLANYEAMQEGGGIPNSVRPRGGDCDCEMQELLEAIQSLLIVPSTDTPTPTDNSTSIQMPTPEQQVFDRLFDLWSRSRDLKCDLPLKPILLRFKNDLLSQNVNLARSFAAQRQFADRIYSFHNEIDSLMNLHQELIEFEPPTTATDSDIRSWHEKWHSTRQADLFKFGLSLQSMELTDPETCTCLLFELSKRRDAYTSIDPNIIQCACNKLREMPGVYVPNWFIPHYEVTFDEVHSFSRGSFGSVHHGQWMGSRAVIKKVFSTSPEEFEKEVEIWSRLYHPHVLQLFGACHVGQKFLVSEFAEFGQLDVYLRTLKNQPYKRSRKLWRTLWEAALGLQYLHFQSIIHCDLKCNNILIGRDGKAKVSDYGLSRTQQPEKEDTDATAAHGVGAPRWKAPEVLNGKESTAKSDVYSFGMCMVEAVTGTYPWISTVDDRNVSEYVRNGGRLFDKPEAFTEVQWNLVKGACEFHPAKRLPMAEIIEQLQVFANEAKEEEAEAIESGTSSSPQPTEEPAPETDESRNDSFAISDLQVPGAMGNQPTGLRHRTSNAIDKSYQDSWNC